MSDKRISRIGTPGVIPASDGSMTVSLQIEIRRLQRKLGKTFILVTHDQDEAMTVSDRVMVMNRGRIEQAGTPTEVYEHPVSRFVAQFLGAANLIPAEASADGLVTPFGMMQARETPQWQQGTLAIRPERIRIHHEQPQRNFIHTGIRDVIYRGDHFEVFVNTGGLRVKTTPAERLRPGQQVWLELPPEHLEVLCD